MKKIIGFFRLIRFELPFSAGVCVVMGQLLASGKFASIPITVLGFLSVFSISASILVLNDYFDFETDKINAPERPIPSNMVTRREALYFSIFLLIGGLILSYLLGNPVFVFSILLSVIGFLYNRKYKQSGLAGNIMVSFSVGMTFIYGGMTVGAPFNKSVLFFGVIAALIDLGEEIAADAMDMQGDSLIDSSSLAIKYGKNTALITSSVIFILVIVLSGLPFILRWFKVVYLLPISIMDTAIGWSTFKLWKTDDRQRRRYIRRIYLGSTLGILIFIIMRAMEI